jgi:hypothetical protein
MRESLTPNVNGTVVRVSEVWQTETDRLPRVAGQCLRGLIARYGKPARCTGVQCQHDANY